MNESIDLALTRAAEKLLERTLSRNETLYLLAGFYVAEGTLRDRIVTALADCTALPRVLLERAACERSDRTPIRAEIVQIFDAWSAAA
jgi:hypothetical protein